MKGKKRNPPRDINQLAKYIVELSTGTLDNDDTVIPDIKISKKKVHSTSGKAANKE